MILPSIAGQFSNVTDEEGEEEGKAMDELLAKIIVGNAVDGVDVRRPPVEWTVTLPTTGNPVEPVPEVAGAVELTVAFEFD